LIKQLEFESISAVDSNAQTEIVVKNSVQLLLKSGTQADRLFGGRPVYFFADSVRDLQTFINQLGY
jgi:hypothetical protein